MSEPNRSARRLLLAALIVAALVAFNILAVQAGLLPR